MKKLLSLVTTLLLANTTLLPMNTAQASDWMVEFHPDSFMYRKLKNPPIDPKSDFMLERLVRNVSNNYKDPDTGIGIAAVNAYQYNSSFYTVGNSTPRYDMTFLDCQNKGYLDHQFAGALKQVPIPDNAVTAAGRDKNLTIYDKDNDRLWEFWIAEKYHDDTLNKTNWRACWGGRIDNVSENQGQFPGYTGATATGIAMAATSISVAEAKAGLIEHAMYLVIIEPRRHDTFSWPALRSDGHIAALDSIPEGRRLRLDPSLDIEQLDLMPFAKTVAKAAQDYGFIVMDKGGAVAVVTESGEPHKQRTGINPWDEIFSDAPSYKQLKNFPWDKLQVLPKDYGKYGDAQFGRFVNDSFEK